MKSHCISLDRDSIRPIQMTSFEIALRLQRIENIKKNQRLLEQGYKSPMSNKN